MYSNGKKPVQVLDGMLDAYRVEKNLQRVDRHFHDIFIFGAKLQNVYHFIYYRIFKVLVLAKIIFEYYLNNSDEHHQRALLEEVVGPGFLVERKLKTKSLEKADREV